LPDRQFPAQRHLIRIIHWPFLKLDRHLCPSSSPCCNELRSRICYLPS
jgi:hypothetical protein